MRRPILSTIGLLFIALFVSACFFLAGPEGEVTMLQQSPLPTTAGPTPLPTPEFCISATHDCVVLAFLGYETSGDGITTLNYRITNNCADEVEYFAIETGFWTRNTPTNGSSYSGSLGSHAVSWVDEQQGIPTQGLRFDSQATGFKEGAAELYTFTVRDFTPRSPNTGRVVVGDRELAFRMMLLDPACEIGVNPTPRPTPTAPFSPLPTPIPTPVEVALPAERQVSLCSFGNNAPPPGVGSKVNGYRFSEPEVVLTHDASIGLAQWLPDGENLLISRDESGTQYNSLDVFNTQTREIAVYAIREHQSGVPIWLPEADKVAYVNGEELAFDLYTSNGNPQLVRRVLNEVNGSSISIAPNGYEAALTMRRHGTKLYIWDSQTSAVQAPPIDMAQWRYQKTGDNKLDLFPTSFITAWHPENDEIALYGGPYLFLFDLATNQACEVDLGGRPGLPRTYAEQPRTMSIAKWSPSGRYLAVRSIAFSHFLGESLADEITIIDFQSGEINNIVAPLPTIDNFPPYIDEFEWLSDDQTIVFSGRVEMINGYGAMGIFLVDIHLQIMTRVLPSHSFGITSTGNSLIWSDSSNKLALLCPAWSDESADITSYNLCLVDVSVVSQR